MSAIVADKRAQRLAAHYDPTNLAKLATGTFTHITDTHVADISALLDDPSRVSVDRAVLEAFSNANCEGAPKLPDTLLNKRQSTDRSHFDAYPVAIVIYAMSTEEVSRVLKYCNDHKIAVTPCGTRTGLEGSSLSIIPGVMIDLSRMNRVLELNTKEMLVTVEPGVEKMQLQRYLSKHGLFFAVDPGSNACMGGYANTGASGTLAVKYGTMRENCRYMTVVLPDGRIIERTRSRAVKSSAGYNLHQLFIGSEGTLGVVTKLVLSIRRLPRVTVSARAQFQSTGAATACVTALMQEGLNQLARAELMNKSVVEAINLYTKGNLPPQPLLLLELHADTTEEAASCIERLEKVVNQCGATGFATTTDEQEANKMWQARRDAYFAAFQVDRSKANAAYNHRLSSMSAEARARTPSPKLAIFTTDVCVPLPELEAAITAVEEDFAKYSVLPCPVVAHAGDGNFHCMIPYNIHDEEEVAQVTALNARMVRRAIAVGGTISGEHGVGLGKMQFLEEERGMTSVDVMRAVKRAIDPHGIMNPYKVFTPLACECTDL